MKHFFTVLALALVITGFGCRKPVATTTSWPETPERISENIAGDLTITTHEIKRESILNDSASCIINLQFPDLAEAGLTDNLRAEVENIMWPFLADALGQKTEIKVEDDLELLAQATLDECRTQIEREYNDLAGADDQLFINLKRTIEVVYAVKLNQDGLLSLGLEKYAYLGGAHPDQNAVYVNVDVNNEQVMTLDEVIKPDGLKEFLQLEKAELLANSRDLLYPESAAEFDAFIENDDKATAEEQQVALGGTDNFYLTPEAIVTYYNAYEIAPYAAGPIMVEIPYSEISDLLVLDALKP